MTEEPDMRHPKIQLILASRARMSIILSIIEDLLEDPEQDFCSMVMEYWDDRHDAIKAKLINARRYEKLRVMHWSDSPLAIAVDPQKSVKLGHDTLSEDRLDDFLDNLNDT